MLHRAPKLLAPLLALLALAACAAPEQPTAVTTQPTTAPSGALPATYADVFALPVNQAGSLSPFAAVDPVNAQIAALVCDPLFSLDGSFAVKPVLVDSYSSNGAIYTFTLKSGINFTDGTPLTAADAVYTLNTMRTSPDCAYNRRLEKIIAVTETGELTFTVTTSEINYLLPLLLDLPVVKRPGDGAVTDPAADPVGTGRYLLVRDDAGDYLSPNPNWRQGMPGGRAVRLVPVVDGEGMANMFDSNMLDSIVLDTGSNLEINLSGGYLADTVVTNRLTYVGMNMRSPILALSGVRSAVSAGINRSKIIEDVINRSGYLTYMPINPAWELYDLTAATTSYTASAARAALAELGLRRDDTGSPVFDDPAFVPEGEGDGDSGGSEDAAPEALPAELEVLVNGDNFTRLTVAQYVRDNLESLGFTATVLDVPYDEYLLRIQTGDFDLFIGEVRIPGDMDIDFLVGADGALNYGGFACEELDEALHAMRTSNDLAARREAVAEAQELLLRETPVIALYYSVTSRLVRPTVITNGSPTVTDIYSGIQNWRRRNG